MSIRFPVRARALVRLTLKAPLTQLRGYKKDGSPIAEERPQWTLPGEVFEITDQKMLDELISPTNSLECFAELIGDNEESLPYEGTALHGRGPRRRVHGERMPPGDKRD